MSNRIFLGIPVSAEVIAQVHFWRSRWEELAVPWIPDHHLHITLLPPWEEVRLESVVTLLHDVLQGVPQFSLEYDSVHVAPKTGPKRYIWLAAKHSPALDRIKGAAEQSLGQVPERRAFLPHVTLSRLKPEHAARVEAHTVYHPVQWGQLVDHLVLYESRLLPEGAQYRVLADFPLTKKEDDSPPQAYTLQTRASRS